MPTSYFTFGQNHYHNVFNRIFNKDTVLKITATDPRQFMFDTFNSEWSFEYEKAPDMSLFPGGVIELNITNL